MDRFIELLQRALFASVPIIGVMWVFSVPDYFGVAFTFQQVVGTMLGTIPIITIATRPRDTRRAEDFSRPCSELGQAPPWSS